MQKKYLKEITGLVLVCHLYLQRWPEAEVLLSEESEETTPVFLIIIMEVIIIMEILSKVLWCLW